VTIERIDLKHHKSGVPRDNGTEVPLVCRMYEMGVVAFCHGFLVNAPYFDVRAVDVIFDQLIRIGVCRQVKLFKQAQRGTPHLVVEVVAG